MPPPGVAVLISYIRDFGVESPVIRAEFVPHKYRSTTEIPFDDGAEYDDDTDKFYWPAGWYELNEHNEMHWYVIGNVTHWMPMPIPADRSSNIKKEQTWRN